MSDGESPTTTERSRARESPATTEAPARRDGEIEDFGTPTEHASEVVAEREVATSGDPDPPPSREGVRRVLIFLNEVAGGRKLMQAARELAGDGADYFAVVAPQNQPIVGQLVDVDELRDAAQSRVDVTMQVLDEFGIDSVGAVMDRDSALALDDAVRATTPDYVLLSCLYETRFGLRRRDLVEWAKANLGTRVEHIPVRVEDDAVRWDLIHTLVVATRTVHSPDLLARLKSMATERPHRYTFVSPPSGGMSREQVCAALAATLAEMYREKIDATGQPMSPEPLAAIRNAIEHYRLDEVLISTLKGRQSVWLQQGLIDQVKAITDMPVEHVESEPGPEASPAPAMAGAGAEASA